MPITNEEVWKEVVILEDLLKRDPIRFEWIMAIMKDEIIKEKALREKTKI